MFGAIHGAVLSSGAAEADLKIGELPLYKAFDVSIHEGVNGIQEGKNLPVVLQELDHLRVHSGKLSVIFIFAGIVHGPAVEYIASSIAGGVSRYSLLVCEAVYFHFKAAVFGIDIELLHLGK